MSANNSPTDSLGPGKTLYQARTALGLNPDNVAQMLHLSPRQIIALENDDYDNLPEPTYVRGYLRSYSQLLGLSSDTIIEAYTRLHESHAKVNLGKLARPPQVTSNDKLIRVSTFLVVGLIIGMVVVWWQGRDSLLIVDKSAPSHIGNADSSLHTMESAVDESLLGPELFPSESAMNDLVADDTLSASLPVVSTTGAEIQTPKPVARPKPEKEVTKVVANAPRSVEPLVAGAPSSVTSLDTEPMELKKARLVLYAEEDCWADIRDAKQKKLLYQTVAAGRVVTLEGVPPFNVFLGNVDGVRLELNGKAYDASRHRRGLVARFTIDVDGEASN